MTDFLYALGFLTIVGVVAALLASLHVFIRRCDHQWTLIKNSDLIKYNREGKEVPYGYLRVHECEKCKKLKKQQVEMD